MNLKMLILFLLISAIFILSIDLIGNPLKVFDATSISSSFIAAYIFFLVFLIRLITTNPKISKRVSNLFIVMSFLIIGVSTFFTLLNYFLYPNFVYSITLINTHILMFIGILTGSSFLIFQKNEFYIKNFSKLLIFLPTFFVLLILVMMLWPLNLVSSVVGEDKIVENLQFIVLIFGSVGAFFISKKCFKKDKKISLFYIIAALVLIFIAMDEISWGQRLLNLSTPEKIKDFNTQGEITIHNFKFVTQLIPIGYIIIGFYGSILALILRLTNKSRKFLFYFVPDKKYFLIFILPALYNLYTQLFDHRLGNLSEPAELLVYLALCLYFLEKGLSKKSSKQA